MKIGIIGAMSVEVDAIKALIREPQVRTVSGVEFISGTLNGTSVVVAQCGIGKVFAALCAQTMIVSFSVDQIINVGVAGSLCSELGLLELAISSSVVQHDMDTSPLGDPVGMISGINKVELAASDELCAKAETAASALGKHCLRGVIASGDQFIASEAKKSFIRDTFSAIACDMEGAAIGHVCYVNRIPFVLIRSISDNASDESGSMEYPELCRHAAEQSQKILWEMLK